MTSSLSNIYKALKVLVDVITMADKVYDVAAPLVRKVWYETKIGNVVIRFWGWVKSLFQSKPRLAVVAA